VRCAAAVADANFVHGPCRLAACASYLWLAAVHAMSAWLLIGPLAILLLYFVLLRLLRTNRRLIRTVARFHRGHLTRRVNATG